MGLDDRDYMRDRYRKRQGLDPDGTTWNDKKARRKQSRAAHKKAVPLGSASWVGKTIDMEPGSGGGAWFAAKNRGFDYQKGRFRPAPPLYGWLAPYPNRCHPTTAGRLRKERRSWTYRFWELI